MAQVDDLCRAFQSQSRRTFRLLAKGNLAAVKLAEETLTNLLLVQLTLDSGTGFVIKGYSKADESMLGADWEMWIGGRSGSWLPCRIQAKVLNQITSAFDHLHYRKDASSPYQCDTLMRNARSVYPRRVPLYVLYAHIPPGWSSGSWRCGSFSPNRELLGCSLVTAETVHWLRTVGLKRSLTDLLPFIRPWHCLVCCSGFGGGDLAERAESWLARTRYPLSGLDVREGLEGRGADGDEVLPFLTRELPPFVTALLSGGTPELPSDIGGLLVVREMPFEEPG